MKSFKIPRQINMLGRTIKIEYDQKILHSEDALGLACYRDDKIILAPRDSSGKKKTQQQMECSFLHELVHWLLYMHGDYGKKLHTDERLVDSLAGGLREALLQIKFE